MSLLLISTAIFVIKCMDNSSVTKQLKALFDVFDVLDYRGLPAAYFEKFSNIIGESTSLPHRIFVEFYRSDGTDKIKILLDGTFTLYDDKLAHSTFRDDGYQTCIHCDKIVGCAQLDSFKTYKSRIVIFFKDLNLLRFSNMKVQAAEALEIFMYLASTDSVVTTGPIREVVVTKTVIDDGVANIQKLAKVVINDRPAFVGTQP